MTASRLSRRQVVEPGLGVLTGLLLGGLMLGPALTRRGYVLVGDMVFVPNPPWKDAYLGLDGSLPRAVPTDALVWLLSQGIPGDLVQKVFLLGSVVVAVTGVWCLLRGAPLVARAAAGTAYVWTPYWHDRLLIGQWSLLASCALMPWVLVAADGFVGGTMRKGWSALALTLVAAALMSPSGGAIAATLALAVAVAHRRGRTATFVICVVANAPWIVPGLLSQVQASAVAKESVTAFAARAESGAGLLPSLLSGGGIWKTSIVAGERGSAVVVALSLALVLAALAGLSACARLLGGRTMAALGAVAAGGVLLATLGATAAGQHALLELFQAAPGASILRDTTRYLAPLTLLVALGVGGLVSRLLQTTRERHAGAMALAVVAVAWPVLCLPSLVWGGLGRLEPVTYPAEWAQVRAQLAQRGTSGDVIVLPWEGPYRRFDWNLDRAGLDPSPRYFPGAVLVDDALPLGDVTLPREDPGAQVIADGLGSSSVTDALLRAGVSGVLVERGTPGLALPDVNGTIVHEGPELLLLDLGPATSLSRVAAAERAAVMAADVACLLLTLAAASGLFRSGLRVVWRHL